MIDILIKIYSSIQDRNRFLKKVRFYSLLRFIVRIIANALLPVYFRVSNLFHKHRLGYSNKDTPEIIVSLTTFPARINRVWIVIECVLRQTYLPDKVILWLSKEQFDGLPGLPKTLLKLQNRGLQINFCEGDLRSHKKYYYTLKDYPQAIFITIDDDLLYRSALVGDLVELHKKYPGAICCDRAFIIKKGKGELLPYSKWELKKSGGEPSYDLFQTSGGGTLFPPGSLSKEVLNEKVFMSYCRYADDIWLNTMSQINNTRIVKTDSDTTWIPILNKGNTTLMSINVDEGQNDVQLEDVRNYYKNTINRDPFSNFLAETV